MAVRNFDYALTLHGDLTVPLYDVIVGNNIRLGNSTGQISATSFLGSGASLTNLSAANMAGVLLLDGTRPMTGNLNMGVGNITLLADKQITLGGNTFLTYSTSTQKVVLVGGPFGFYLANNANNTRLIDVDSTGNTTFVGNIAATGKTITAGTINAVTALQENGVALSSKYLPLTGGTVTGLLTLNQESLVVRVPTTAGSWARGVHVSDAAANTVFFSVGGYGTGATLNYNYIGYSASPWSSTYFRMYNDGRVEVTPPLILTTQATTTAHAVRADRTITAGSGLSGGGNLTADRSFTVNFTASGGDNGTAITVARGDHVHSEYLTASSVASDSSKLGGILASNYLRSDVDGSITGSLTITGNLVVSGTTTSTFAGDITATGKVITAGTLNAVTALQVNGVNINTLYVPVARNIIAGTGLTGGGTLAADRTLAINFGTAANTVAMGNHTHDYQQYKLTNGPLAITATVDWNNYVDTGFYMGSSLLNAPTATGANTWWFVEVMKHNSVPYVVQTAWDFNGVAMATRTCTNNVWKDWKYIWHSSNFNPALKVDTTRSIFTGTGLSGGGDFSTDRTFSVAFGTTATTVAAGNHTHTSFPSGFVITGVLNVGTNGTVGNLSIKDSTGNLVIKLDGTRTGAVPSTPNILMDGDGNATFKGLVALNNMAITSNVRIDNLNAQFLDGKTITQLAGTESMFDIHGAGVISGVDVIETAVPSASIRVTAGVAYTSSGRRVVFTGAEQRAIAAASATFYRNDIVYIHGASSGTNEGTLGIVAGLATSNTAAGAVSPTRAPNGSAPTTYQYPYDAVVLARLAIKPLGQYSGGNATILNADISNTIKDWRPILFNGLDFKVGSSNSTVNLSTNGSLTVDGTITEGGRLLTAKYAQLGLSGTPVNNTLFGRQLIQTTGTLGGVTNGAAYYLKLTDGNSTMAFDPNEILTNTPLWITAVAGDIFLNTEVQVSPTGFLRGNKNATIAIFAIGETKKRWTHNYGGTTYSVMLASNSFQRHVRWTNKTANYVEIELDNPATEEIQVDITLIGRSSAWGIS